MKIDSDTFYNFLRKNKGASFCCYVLRKKDQDGYDIVVGFQKNNTMLSYTLPLTASEVINLGEEGLKKRILDICDLLENPRIGQTTNALPQLPD